MSMNMSSAVVLVTHGGAGAAMLDAAQRVVGPLDRVATVGVLPGDAPVDVERRIEDAVATVGAGNGVVFLVDLGGSTPFNLCCRACNGASVVVTGMNMPMLFKLATVDRTRGPRPLAEELASTGLKSILVKVS